MRTLFSLLVQIDNYYELPIRVIIFITTRVGAGFVTVFWFNKSCREGYE